MFLSMSTFVKAERTAARGQGCSGICSAIKLNNVSTRDIFLVSGNEGLSTPLDRIIWPLGTSQVIMFNYCPSEITCVGMNPTLLWGELLRGGECGDV